MLLVYAIEAGVSGYGWGSYGTAPDEDWYSHPESNLVCCGRMLDEEG